MFCRWMNSGLANGYSVDWVSRMQMISWTSRVASHVRSAQVMNCFLLSSFSTAHSTRWLRSTVLGYSAALSSQKRLVHLHDVVGQIMMVVQSEHQTKLKE